MSLFKEIPPTAGWPLSVTAFLRSFAQKSSGSLQNDFSNFLNIPYVQVTNSGTVAFYVILETLKKLSKKTTVVIPSYICPLIPLAIKRAGLNVEICDVAANSFDYDYQQLENLCAQSKDILAILAVHLAGIPVSLEKLTLLARNCEAFIVEDCAQSLGAQHKGRYVGTVGDFSFFSFAAGKGLTIYEGGIIATTHSNYAVLIEETHKTTLKYNFFRETLKIIELFGYSIFYRPQLFWFVFTAPQFFWRLQGDEVKAFTDYFSIDFPVHLVSSFRQRIAHNNFYRLNCEIERQREKALHYIEFLKNIKGLTVIKEYPQDRATYPYVSVVFDTPDKQKRALKAFAGLGLGISRVYLSAIGDYEYLKELLPIRSYPNGRSVSERTITLSTSTFLKERDLDSVVDIIKGL
jgi:perosamine synthetase